MGMCGILVNCGGLNRVIFVYETTLKVRVLKCTRCVEHILLDRPFTYKKKKGRRGFRFKKLSTWVNWNQYMVSNRLYVMLLILQCRNQKNKKRNKAYLTFTTGTASNIRLKFNSHWCMTLKKCIILFNIMTSSRSLQA